MGKFSKGPSAGELQAQQEAAAKAEREKIAQEQAIAEANLTQKKQAAFSEQESKRRAFASQPIDDDEQRRKFMKGA